MPTNPRRISKSPKPASYKVLNESIGIAFGDPDLDFPFFLRVKTTRVGESRWNINSLAPALDVSPQTVKQWRAGHTNFPIDKLRELYEHTKDPDIPSYVNALMGLHWFEVPEPGAEEAPALISAAVVKEAAEAVQKFLDALEDRRIDRNELVEIEREYEEAQRALAVLITYARRMERSLLLQGGGANERQRLDE